VSANHNRAKEPARVRLPSAGQAPRPRPPRTGEPRTQVRLPRWAALAVIVAVAAAAGVYALVSRGHQATGEPVAVAPGGADVCSIVEGQAGYQYPYDPQVLHVKAGRAFDIRLTDHLGGCGLGTVFTGLGKGGGTVVVNVPVGDSKTVALRAPHPGRYVYHCGSDMYFGTIVAS